MRDMCCGPRGGEHEDDRKDANATGSSGTLGAGEGSADSTDVVGSSGSMAQPPGDSKVGGGPLSSRRAPPGAFARLLVRVESAEGLIGMDIAGIRTGSLSLERTLDAYVCLRINDEETPFGKTTVKWQSKGDAVWDERFSVDVNHPKSYLCIQVMDDDFVFRQDNPLTSFQRSCGFLEIPLWPLPRNRVVVGWFTLRHPEAADSRGSLGDRLNTEKDDKDDEREADNAADAKDPKHDEQNDSRSAGRLKLELLLETDPASEIRGNLRPAPVFAASLPPLNLPQFLEDIFEIKRIFVGRLLMPPIAAVTYALSWDNIPLSSAVLLWWWLLLFRPRMIWATVFLFVLLCFWHEMPDLLETEQQQKEEQEETKVPKAGERGPTDDVAGDETNGGGSQAEVELRRGPSFKAFTDGVRKRVTSTASLAAKAATTGAEGFRTGVVGITSSVTDQMNKLHAPGLQEFQQILSFSPPLKRLVRRLQPTASSVRRSLQSVDDLFYWGVLRATKNIVIGLSVAFVFSLFFSHTTAALIWYISMYGGTFAILSHLSIFKMAFIRFPLAALATFTRPQVPFRDCAWYEDVS